MRFIYYMSLLLIVSHGMFWLANIIMDLFMAGIWQYTDQKKLMKTRLKSNNVQICSNKLRISYKNYGFFETHQFIPATYWKFPSDTSTKHLTRRVPQVRHQEKVMIPVMANPNVNFMGLLIGPRGNSLKKLEEETNTKIMIRGLFVTVHCFIGGSRSIPQYGLHVICGKFTFCFHSLT